MAGVLQCPDQGKRAWTTGGNAITSTGSRITKKLINHFTGGFTLANMVAPSTELLKLKDYLLKEKPQTIASVNQLCKQFKIVEPKSVRNTLERAGYVKAKDGPTWTLPITSFVDQDIRSISLDRETGKLILEHISNDEEWSLANLYAPFLEQYEDNPAKLYLDCALLITLMLKHYNTPHYTITKQMVGSAILKLLDTSEEDARHRKLNGPISIGPDIDSRELMSND